MTQIFDLDSFISNWWKEQGIPGDFTIDNSGLTVTLLKFTYTSPTPTDIPLVVASADYFNGTSTTNTETFHNSKSTTASFQWSLTEGLKLGAKTAFEVGSPVIGDIQVEASIELSFSATETQTTSETQEWSWDTQVPIPPHSHVHLDAIVNNSIYNPKFTALIGLSGSSTVSNQDHTSAGGNAIGLIVQGQPGFQVSPDLLSAVYTATGMFKGVQGISTVIKTQEI